MQALFAASLVLLAQKILLQIIAIDFHKKSLSDRLDANQAALRALGTSCTLNEIRSSSIS